MSEGEESVGCGLLKSLDGDVCVLDSLDFCGLDGNDGWMDGLGGGEGELDGWARAENVCVFESESGLGGYFGEWGWEWFIVEGEGASEGFAVEEEDFLVCFEKDAF